MPLLQDLANAETFGAVKAALGALLSSDNNNAVGVITRELSQFRDSYYLWMVIYELKLEYKSRFTPQEINVLDKIAIAIETQYLGDTDKVALVELRKQRKKELVANYANYTDVYCNLLDLRQALEESQKLLEEKREIAKSNKSRVAQVEQPQKEVAQGEDRTFTFKALDKKELSKNKKIDQTKPIAGIVTVLKEKKDSLETKLIDDSIVFLKNQINQIDEDMKELRSMGSISKPGSILQSYNQFKSAISPTLKAYDYGRTLSVKIKELFTDLLANLGFGQKSKQVTDKRIKSTKGILIDTMTNISKKHDRHATLFNQNGSQKQILDIPEGYVKNSKKKH